MASSRLFRYAPFAALLAEVLAFYRHVLFYGGYVIPWDLRYYHLPIAEFVAKSLRHGELPLWNPFSYCGAPLYANLTAQVFYPPTLVITWFSNLAGGDHLLYFLEWQIVLHVFLGGVFTFWLLRRLGACTTGALVAATIFQLGGFFASQVQHLGAVNGGAWLPLAWLSVISLAAKFRWRWLAALAVSFVMSILAGFPAVTANVIGASLLLALLLALLHRASRRLVAVVLLACVWAALLAAVQILPTAELTQLSVAKFRSEWMGAGGGLPLQSLVSLILPSYYGIFDLSTYSLPWQPTLLYLYCGIPGLLLALAMVLHRRNPHAGVYALATGLSVLWMLGDSTPVGKTLLSVFPGILRSAIYPEFAMLSFTLCVAVLAGLGAHNFFGPRKALFGSSLVALIALDLIAVGSGRPMNTASLAREPGLTYTHFDGSRVVLDRVHELVHQSSPPARIDTVNDSMNWAMGASLTEVPTANGNDPFALVRLMQIRLALTEGERWGRYYEVSKLDSPLLDLLNVRFLLSRTPLDHGRIKAAKFTKVAELPGREVYENREVLPRFFLVSRVRTVRDMDEGLAVLRSPDFDPRAIAVVEGPLNFVNAAREPPGGSVKLLEYRARRIILEVDSPEPAFLVTSETYYPGWLALVDGSQEQLALTNVAFRGLLVPAGKHKVTMQFEPAILERSAPLTIFAWLALIVAVVFGDNRRKQG